MSAALSKNFIKPEPPKAMDVVEWVNAACSTLSADPALIQHSFDVTGINLNPDGLSDGRLQNALKDCAGKLKEQFGENFNESDFSIGIVQSTPLN